ncbi:hypothetical protein GQ457_05G027830 [Hibiscus cannabinus]
MDPTVSHESKKAKSDNPLVFWGAGVCDIEAGAVFEPTVLGSGPLVNESMDVGCAGVKNMVSKDVQESSGVGQPKRNALYAQVTTYGSNRNGWFDDEQSLNTEDVIVLDEVGEKGKFARLAVIADLNKPLKACIEIDNFVQKLEYEGL